jgi:hypothetical protein
VDFFYFCKLIEVIDIVDSFGEDFMQPSKIKDPYSIFDKKIGFYHIYFIKHGIIEDGEFFEGLIEEGEGESGF